MALCLCGLVASFFVRRERKPREALQPLLLSAADGPTARPLPDDALVVTLADGAELVTPFALREDASAVGGVALALPKGAGTRRHTGRAAVALNVPERPAAPASGAAKYHAWARVYWRDSCSNSASLKVGAEPERDFGNDCVYKCWHWVRAGLYALPPGKVPVAVIEREDGILLDQLLFTRDPAYLPVGPIGRAGEGRGIRRFADDFGRSPGHGLEDWELLGGKWRINFSFDPNRIPNQYTLVGEAPATAGQAGKPDLPALALVKGAPWYGCTLAFSFSPLQEGRYGAVVDCGSDLSGALFLGFELAGGQSSLAVSGGGVQGSVNTQGLVRLNQWHRVVVERWAWITRVWVDGRMVLASYAAAPHSGKAGLFVAGGAAAFDDVELEEAPWQADDGNTLSLPWVASADAKWYRGTEEAGKALIGHSGSISAGLGGMALEEVVLEEMPQAQGRCIVVTPGLQQVNDPPAVGRADSSPYVRVLRRSELAMCGADIPPAGRIEACATKAVLQAAGAPEARVRRVAFRYGESLRKNVTLGQYDFTETEVADPSDYLDFTPEELRAMAQSPEADKLIRRQKMIPLIGDPSEELSLWLCEAGNWRVRDGALRGTGPDAVLRHAYELSGDVEFRCRLRLREPNSVAVLGLYAGPERGVRVQVAGGKALTPAPGGAAVTLPHHGDENWHQLLVRVSGGTLWAALDKDAPQEVAVPRGDGSRILLKVPLGRVEFDDIEITTPRGGTDGGLYTFQQQETDWWREGSWVDHAGNACVLASNWISLMAPQGAGMLWNKRCTGPDVLVGFDIEEGSEWFGWSRPHQGHVHHPADNIRVALVPTVDAAAGKLPDLNQGYRLEVNAQNRTATVLYRNGKEVARVAQGGNFPIRYAGGHAPYYPRRNHITLVKRGALVRAIVNAREVLRFTDPEPLDVGNVGVGGYNTWVNFGHLEVRRLAPGAAGATPAVPSARDGARGSSQSGAAPAGF